MSDWRQALRRFAKEVLDVRDLIDPFGLRPAGTSVDPLLEALAAETDDVARTSLLEALGHTRSQRATTALAAVIADPTTDAEHRETAARSLRHVQEAR